MLVDTAKHILQKAEDETSHMHVCKIKNHYKETYLISLFTTYNILSYVTYQILTNMVLVF